ncbi:hypothetical protein Mgra_00006692 [Meloidogyne graminicola]|uniref:Uncharacterized protein n=1 Tax=Meloidogyne graminicola TaxID=189291 RepID=A0A8S9ZKZ0_9BILA|nr:hypothetical protein Mgra_00006692 [Meloidogyne graminicola]
MSNTTFVLPNDSSLIESTISSLSSLVDNFAFCDASVMKGLEIWLLVMAFVPFIFSLITISALLVAINAIGKISDHQVEVDNKAVWIRHNAKGTACQPYITEAFRSFALKNKELAKIA